MTADPAPTAVASPFEPAALLIVATPVLEELQVAKAVRSCVVLFENVPVALNCCVDPFVRAEVRGVTAIEVNVAGSTVNVVDADMLPDVAVIVVEPAATGVISPFEPAALLIVATEVDDELQVTVVVRFCFEPSEYVPVAVSCCVVPIMTVGLAGVIATETSVAGFTVSVVDPDRVPDVAVIVVEPAATGVASPIEPAVLLIPAMDDDDELQVTAVVRFCVEPSEYVPVAVNCCVLPMAMLGLVGVIATETSVAGFTISVVDPDRVPDVAVIVVEPAAAAVTSPIEPAVLLIPAMDDADELQTTSTVRSWVVLSENVPVAMNC